jgi:hypothetical protein
MRRKIMGKEGKRKRRKVCGRNEVEKRWRNEEQGERDRKGGRLCRK